MTPEIKGQTAGLGKRVITMASAGLEFTVAAKRNQTLLWQEAGDQGRGSGACGRLHH